MSTNHNLFEEKGEPRRNCGDGHSQATLGQRIDSEVKYLSRQSNIAHINSLVLESSESELEVLFSEAKKKKKKKKKKNEKKKKKKKKKKAKPVGSQLRSKHLNLNSANHF